MVRRTGRNDPDVETVTWWLGTSGGGSGGNQANINVQLKPVGVRKSHVGSGGRPSAAPDVRMPGATMFLQNTQDVRIGGRQGNAQYQYTLQAPDFASLAVWGPEFSIGSRLPEIADVSPTSRIPACRPMSSSTATRRRASA